MVWRADNDGVDILLHFVEHDTIVVKLRHFGELTEAFCTSLFVDVTQGNDILAGDSCPPMPINATFNFSFGESTARETVLPVRQIPVLAAIIFIASRRLIVRFMKSAFWVRVWECAFIMKSGGNVSFLSSTVKPQRIGQLLILPGQGLYVAP